MRKKPEVLRSKNQYNGWLKLRVDILKLPGTEKPYPYDVVEIGDGVAVLPFLDKETLLLAEQYRHPVGETLLELIQGGIRKNETIVEAAKRELLEETGYTGNVKNTYTMYPLPGSLDMRLYIVEATELEKIQEPGLDATESLTLVERSYKQVLEEVLSGKHKDSALAWAVLYHEVRNP
ncbi:MAG: NUDIX hydrolase [Candidatus Aenigmatarchaeota archaeon]